MVVVNNILLFTMVIGGYVPMKSQCAALTAGGDRVLTLLDLIYGFRNIYVHFFIFIMFVSFINHNISFIHSLRILHSSSIIIEINPHRSF